MDETELNTSITETVSENELNEIGEGINQLNMVTIQKMIFIYNAINSGWTVRKIKETTTQKPRKSPSKIKPRISKIGISKINL